MMKNTKMIFLMMLFSSLLNGQSFNNTDVKEATDDFPAPLGFTATVMGSNNDVNLEWIAPGGVGNIQWDNGINNGNGVGINGGYLFSVASRWLPADLSLYDGLFIKKITFFPWQAPDAVLVLKVWTGENAETEVLSQPIETYIENEFNEIILDVPVQIDASQELWFGYEVVEHSDGTFPAGADDGPAIEGFGDMILLSFPDATWESMSASYDLDYNWNLSAYLDESKKGSSSSMPMIRRSETTSIQDTKVSILNESKSDVLGDVVSSRSLNPMAKTNPKSVNNPIGYNVYRDEILIVENIIEQNYTDIDLNPGTYSYDVKAVYNDGISEGAGPESATILNGIDRNLVIVEIATGTWCQYCPGASLGAEDLVANGKDVAIIEYHTYDSYESTETNARIDYYEIDAFPHAEFDGTLDFSGGDEFQSIYSSYLPLYETRIEVPSVFILNANYHNVEGGEYELIINTEMLDAYPNLDNIKLHAVLTESHIEESWQGQSELNYVCRKMIPNNEGTAIDFSVNENQSISHNFTIPGDYAMENLELVVFLQDNESKEILEGVIAEFTSVGINESRKINDVIVYPNPANDYIQISSLDQINTITIYNSIGQILRHEYPNGSSCELDVSYLKNGLYFLKMDTENGRITKHILIN